MDANALRLVSKTSVLILAALSAFAGGVPGVSLAQDAGVPDVGPGRLAAWSAPGTTACFLAGESWKPVGDTCWFPVDLLTPEGTLEVARTRNGTRETARVRVTSYPYKEQRLTVEPGQVNLSAEDLERTRRERARIDALWDLDTPRRFTLPLTSPLEEMPPGGRFGARRVFNDVPKSPHTGSDYAAPTGTPVRAVADGTVALAEEHFFAGKSVFVDHGDGLISMSFHLSDIAVETGQKVEAGQVIGRVGASGRATGPHLHFGVRWHGARVDPADLFDPGRATEIGGR